jgi:hypothetical protein
MPRRSPKGGGLGEIAVQKRDRVVGLGVLHRFDDLDRLAEEAFLELAFEFGMRRTAGCQRETLQDGRPEFGLCNTSERCPTACERRQLADDREQIADNDLDHWLPLATTALAMFARVADSPRIFDVMPTMP